MAGRPGPDLPAIPPKLSPAPRSRLSLWIGLGAAVVCGTLLYFCNPSQFTFYPQCQFRALTGWDCPGCGGLRAIHQLLHGHVTQALRLNPLFVIALPFLGGFGLYRYLRTRPGERMTFHVPAVWLWTGLGVLALYAVLRNWLSVRGV